MGQKVNPVGLRLGIIKGWDSAWFDSKSYAEKIVEDNKIRKYITARIPKGGISKVVIERTLKRITLTIHTARPGVVIGKADPRLIKSRRSLKTLQGKIFRSTFSRSKGRSLTPSWLESQLHNNFRQEFHSEGQ